MVRVGVWEAVYLIQGLLDEQSKVKPSQVHTDTQGQVLPVYALAHLFGFDLTQIRGQILMTEPERHSGDVVARVEKSHRDVWSDGLPGEPRTGLRRGADVLGEAVLDRVRRQLTARPQCREENTVGRAWVLTLPGRQFGGDRGEHRSVPLFPPFALAGEVGSNSELDVGVGERGPVH